MNIPRKDQKEEQDRTFRNKDANNKQSENTNFKKTSVLLKMLIRCIPINKLKGRTRIQIKIKCFSFLPPSHNRLKSSPFLLNPLIHPFHHSILLNLPLPFQLHLQELLQSTLTSYHQIFHPSPSDFFLTPHHTIPLPFPSSSLYSPFSNTRSHFSIFSTTTSPPLHYSSPPPSPDTQI